MCKTTDETPSEQSDLEAAAQAWHEQWHGGDSYEKCWCKCNACETVNPHHHAATRAAFTDIAERLRDSLMTARPPDPRRKPRRRRPLP